jgi:tetratricopeptide (TPR) repeat protein
MSGRNYILTLIVLCLSLVSLAQPGPLAIKAAKLADSGDLIGAQNVIELALESEEAKEAWTWYVKGFILKEIFVEIDNGNVYSKNRELAVESIVKAQELDDENAYSKDIRNALEFLAKTYFNHSVDQHETLDPEMMEGSEAFFVKFKETYLLADPMFDLSSYSVDYYNGLAKSYEKVHAMRSNDQEYIDASIRYYKLALTLAPENYHANYNTAINYYNLAVNRIKKIDHQTEIIELLMIQEECLILFRQSLPHMLKAHKQNPKRKETLTGLMAIYRAMNEYDKSDGYKNALADLIRNGDIRQDSPEKKRP